jgi:hypothetical protein
MFDRQLLGDVGLAILLAVPTLTLSRPQVAIPENRSAATAPLIEQAALAQSTTERRFSLDG